MDCGPFSIECIVDKRLQYWQICNGKIITIKMAQSGIEDQVFIRL